MPGIWQSIGSFGTKVIRLGQDLGRSLGETLGLIQPIAPFIEPMAAARDWGNVSISDALSPDVAKLRDDQFVPRDLFATSDIPWADKYAYEVAIFGRDSSTGQFRRTKFDLTVTREMTIEEIKNHARASLGQGGRYPFSEIFDVAVTGAWKSPEIEW